MNTLVGRGVDDGMTEPLGSVCEAGIVYTAICRAIRGEGALQEA